jgi:AcrR family transcriptional regulator
VIKKSTKQPAARTRAPTPEREPRGARRKRETRYRLLRAAFELMAERGADAVTINEITDAADVGFGSFYNHFASKEAVYEELFAAVFSQFGIMLEQLTAMVLDPAEVISISVRHTIAYARSQPLWGRFFLREGYSPQAIARGLAPHLARDIAKGIAQRRFDVGDPLLATVAAGGVVMGSIAIQAAKLRGMSATDIDQRAAAAVLQNLGLTAQEALKIAKRPLPSLKSTELFL